MARLQGHCSKRNRGHGSNAAKSNYDTVLGHKNVSADPEYLYDEIILKKSSQAIPLLRFNNRITSRPNKYPNLRYNLNDLYGIIDAVKDIVDEYCNDGQATVLTHMSYEEFSIKSTFCAKTPPPSNVPNVGMTATVPNPLPQGPPIRTSMTHRGSAASTTRTTASAFAAGCAQRRTRRLVVACTRISRRSTARPGCELVPLVPGTGSTSSCYSSSLARGVALRLAGQS